MRLETGLSMEEKDLHALSGCLASCISSCFRTQPLNGREGPPSVGTAIHSSKHTYKTLEVVKAARAYLKYKLS